MSPKLMSLREATRMLRAIGFTGNDHRLKRLIVAAERRSGRRIAIRGDGKIQVTESMLRQHLPELFDDGSGGLDEMRSVVRAHLRDVDRVAREAAQDEVATERASRIEGDRSVMASVVEVSEAVESLSRRVSVVERQNAGKVS